MSKAMRMKVCPKKNAEDVKGGAGQYFTPRALIIQP